MGLLCFVEKSVGAHQTGVVVLIFSASDALELESCSMADDLCSAEWSCTVSGGNPDPLARLPYLHL